MTDHERPLPTLLGIPGTDDLKRWRDLLDAAQGGSPDELVGLRALPDGTLVGIFRAKEPRNA
jgi:hypothetical protein